MLKKFGFVKAAVVALGLFFAAAPAQAALINYQVGVGTSTARVLVNFYDEQAQSPGQEYLFEVKFSDHTTGLGLMDIIELGTALDNSVPDLTTARKYWNPPYEGITLDGITMDGNHNQGFTAGRYWQYYTRQAANASWTSSSVGATDRFVHDGDWDAWSFTGASPTGVPVPEPASMLLLALGGSLAFARRK